MNQASMLQGSTHNEGRGSRKALMLLFLLASHYSAEAAPSAPTRITQPLKAWQSLRAPRAGHFMAPVNTQHPATRGISFGRQGHPFHVSNAQSQLQESSVVGRRDMIGKFAAAFALAAAAASNRAEAADTKVAPEKLDKVFGKGEYKEEKDLEKAEDFTNFNKVQKKAGYVQETVTPKPGSVEVNPALIPAVVVFSALATAGVPALLSPGETAFEAQRTQSGKPKKLGARASGKQKKAEGFRSRFKR